MIESAVWVHERTIAVTMEDGTVIQVPDDMANAHRQALEEWSKTQGNEIKAYTPPAEAKE